MKSNDSGKYVFITHDNADATFNIASEQYLLERSNENVVYLWRNRSAVIVGVNQNTLKEVDTDYTSSNEIQVVRRISGGGAVYHDLGNICFTVITDYDENLDNIEEFTRPVTEFLTSLGLDSAVTGRNDITANGYKISGMAQCVKGGRIMRHGTLLFDTDVTVLEKALKPNPLKLKAKGIDSVRKRVMNVKSLMNTDMSADEFFDRFRVYMAKGKIQRDFTKDEISQINELKEQKFATYEWNFGKSSTAQFNRSARFTFGCMDVSFDVDGGYIRNFNIFGDFFSKGNINELISKFNGIKPCKEDIMNALSGVENYILGASAREITEKLFFGDEL